MLKIKYLLCVFLFFASKKIMTAQSYWFGIKGGGAMISQSWGTGFGSSGSSDLGFGPCGDIFVESYDEENKGSLYASLGYHSRGSAIQFTSITSDFSARQTFLFNTASLELGAKKPFFLGGKFDPYFTVGVRGGYTMNTNLDNYLKFNSLYYPSNAFVQKWNYGFSAGGGFESRLSDMIRYFVDVQISPDLSYQYIQPPLFNVPDPWDTSRKINLDERQAKNLSIELKVGIRFLKKVIYVD
jgi:hypothetical protein